MRERRYSNPDGFAPRSKLTAFNAAAAGIAALAGVGFTAWQTFAPSPGPAPINVTVAAPAAPVGHETVAAKAGAAAAGIAPTNFSAALNDGTEKLYAFADLFDGRPETVVTIAAPQSELNVLATLPEARAIAAIAYTPPLGAGPFATALDVMVLPEGRLEPSGRAVFSFTLQTTPGRQVFQLPATERGKALWLRIAAPEGAAKAAAGEFEIIAAP